MSKLKMIGMRVTTIVAASAVILTSVSLVNQSDKDYGGIASMLLRAAVALGGACGVAGVVVVGVKLEEGL